MLPSPAASIGMMSHTSAARLSAIMTACRRLRAKCLRQQRRPYRFHARLRPQCHRWSRSSLSTASFSALSVKNTFIWDCPARC
jgi:hypothetical protein